MSAVTEGHDASAVDAIADELVEHGCPLEQIDSVSIDMSPAFIKGCTEELPNARITVDKFHVVWHDVTHGVVATTRATGAPRAGVFVVARAQCVRAAQFLGSGQLGHVVANLHQHQWRGDCIDTSDGLQQRMRTVVGMGGA